MAERDPDGMVVASGLTKDYGSGHGLFDMGFELRRGEVLGLVGSNGAGKSTCMRIVMGLIRPDRGSVRIFGLDAQRDGLAAKRITGYLPGELPQWPGVSAGHVIGVLAGLRGGIDPARVSQLCARLQLDLTRRYADLSHGNKQKVGLVTAFMHEPDLLVLDEPTLGLDPIMQREVRALIAEAVQAGATCLLPSHVLSEVELVCDRIALLHEGRCTLTGSLNELRQTRVHRVEARMPAIIDAAELASAAALPGVTDVTASEATLSCSVSGSIGALLAWLSQRGAVELDSRELSLEEVFLAAYQATEPSSS